MMYEQVMILNFPPYEQGDEFDCGFGICVSSLLYCGKDFDYQEIAEFLDTDESGTLFTRMIELMNQHEIDCTKKTMDIDEVKQWIRRRIPIILPLQAWSENPVTSYKEIWDQGHYVAVIGFDDKNKKMLFRDPSSKPVTFLTYEELPDRWHDVGKDGKVYENYGLAIYDRKGFPPFMINFNPDTAIHMD